MARRSPNVYARAPIRAPRSPPAPASMPVTSRARETTPVIAWLGAPPPPGVAESLASIARVETRWTPEARLIALWAPAGVEQLGRLPARTRRPPVIAAASHDPSHGERMEWIRAGADDLVSLAALPIAVARRLKSSPGAVPDLTTGRKRDPTSLVEPMGFPEGQITPLPRTADRQPPTGAADAFPPLRVPQPEGGVPSDATLWVEQLQRYLPAREEWTARWGRGGLERMLELAQLRARAEGGTADLYGVANGRPDAPLGWPLLVRRGPSRGRKGIEVAEATVVATGSDGLVIDVPFRATRRQKLVADLQIRDDEDAQLLLEARWQRRVAADRWHLGVLLVEMRIRSLLDT